MPIFQSKLLINKKHISLNSQFNVVLSGIICFSVRFCNNSLLVLKMRFQVFSFASKKVQGFSSDRKMLIRRNHCSFIYKIVSRFFKILTFSQHSWGNVHYVRKINLIS